MTGAERQRRWRERQRTGEQWQPKPCGTIAAARRHQNRSEPLCDLCAPVWAAHQAAMYQQRKQRKQQ